MLDKGRMIKVQTRAWYDALRTRSEEEAAGLPESDRLIRQFLRGDAQGPITDRKDQGLLERALFGRGDTVASMPSLTPTR